MRLANASRYGLGGCVFSADVRHGVEIAQRLDTGMVFINHPTWTNPDLPFGGTKLLGYGHELAAAGLQEYVNKKLINIVPIDAPSDPSPRPVRHYGMVPEPPSQTVRFQNLSPNVTGAPELMRPAVSMCSMPTPGHGASVTEWRCMFR